MHITRALASVSLLALACTSVATARTTRIAELGSSPLLGQITSTQQMRTDVVRHGRLLAVAAQRIGVTSDEYDRFRVAVSQGKAQWVTVPRHLDAMSWRSGRHIHVIRDVIIPANTRGWEVDLDEGDRAVALYMPARCGNLSVLARPVRRVAVAPKPVAPPPQAAPVAPAQPVAAVPAQAPAPEVAAVVPPAPVPPIQAPIYHATRISPFAIIPVLFGLTRGGGGGGGGPTGSTPSTPVGPGCGTPKCT